MVRMKNTNKHTSDVDVLFTSTQPQVGAKARRSCRNARRSSSGPSSCAPPVRGGIQSLQVSSWDCRSEEVSKATAPLGARTADSEESPQKLPGLTVAPPGRCGPCRRTRLQPRLCSVGVTPCSPSPVHPSIFLTFLFRNISINALAFRCFSCWDQDAPSH